MSTTLDWEPGPAQHDIVNGDAIRSKYRNYVENYLPKTTSLKEIFKKKFVSISTNVLCAVVGSTKDTLPNYMRDLYMPVELSITRWSIDMKEKDYVTLHYMFYPGEPAPNCRNYARSHLTKHKIEGIQEGPFETPPEKYKEVLSSIYQMLQGDLVLFSTSIFHIRQDIGSIKWLIDQVSGVNGSRKRYKPLNLYSLEDLYVVIARRVGSYDTLIGKGVAERRLKDTGYEWENELKCNYHNREQNDTSNCTKANCIAKARKLTEDIKLFKKAITDDSTGLEGAMANLSTNDKPSSSSSEK